MSKDDNVTTSLVLPKVWHRKMSGFAKKEGEKLTVVYRRAIRQFIEGKEVAKEVAKKDDGNG